MSNDVAVFRAKIWDFYRDSGRHDLAWRQDVTPYRILVSEVMLQQTQVSRVRIKFEEWMASFPDFESVAQADGAAVLRVWQGLGYNRRGLWLREACRRVVDEYGGVLPNDPSGLVKLPGIGPNTAGSIAAFAYNEPVVFIETNIRRVFIHEFFVDAEGVADAELMPLIEAALERARPREWYWALMDYGADLAKRAPNPNRRSKHYVRQSAFEGSARQIRGEVLRQLLEGPKVQDELGISDGRLGAVLEGLVKDGLVMRDGAIFRLAQ